MPSASASGSGRKLKRVGYFARFPIQEQNQTTQAPYCAAYLSILAAKYGSFSRRCPSTTPAHERRRMLIAGEHLGGKTLRSRYLLGSKLARDLRTLPGKDYGQLHAARHPFLSLRGDGLRQHLQTSAI